MTRQSMLLLSPYTSVRVHSNTTYLMACFFNSSYMKRGERQPVASHGEILQEKLAPYMLFWVLSFTALFGCIQHSAANFFSLSRASASPPMRFEPAADFDSWVNKVKFEVQKNIAFRMTDMLNWMCVGNCWWQEHKHIINGNIKNHYAR